MSSAQRFGRVVWAVDPFGEDVELQKIAASTLDALVGDNSIQVEPLSVIHQPSFEDEARKGEAAARSALSKMMASFGPKNCLPPVVLVQDELALTEAVKRVMAHARDTGAQLIVAGTQAMKGSTSFLLGSFAEALILQSELPILAVSPRTRPITKVNQIVFPTDLSERSCAVFPHVIATAKQLGAEILLFHRIEQKNEAAPNHGLKSHSDGVAEEVLKIRTKEMQALALQAKAEGLEAEVTIQAVGAGSAEAIVELSKGTNRMIVMVTQTKSPDIRRLGEVTRTVLRHAFCPLWIVHPKGLTQN